MKIFLIGLPGSGKTTLGKSLAEKLHIPFTDLDEEIEKEEGVSVKEIFALKGEDYFRAIESRVLFGFCAAEKEFVMATGGGAPCFHDGMTAMKNAGKVVFLDAPPEDIVSRLMTTSLAERPLLSGLSAAQLRQKIETLRSLRIDFYRLADIVLKGNRISPEEIILGLKG